MNGGVEPIVRLLRLPHGAGLPLPAYHSDGAAGFDLAAALPEGEPLTMPPRSRTAVPTGFAIELAPGFEGQIRPRSGLALQYGLTVLNAPGTIDWDYRGEVKALLVNLGWEAVTIRRGARIAQLVIAPVLRARIVEVEALSDTARGAEGFGSTGSAS